MFSVYGLSGKTFSGAMEDLRRVLPVNRAARVQVIERLDFTHELMGQLAPSTHASPQVAPQAPRDAQHAAIDAYAHVTATPQRQPLTLVLQLMSTQVHALTMNLTILDAWHQLAQWGVGQAPVVDEKNRLVGLLTRAELVQTQRLPHPEESSLVWRAFLCQDVASAMITPVPSVSPDADIRRVARVLLDTGLPGLPVVQTEGEVLGFISRSDILRAVVHDPPLDLWT